MLRLNSVESAILVIDIGLDDCALVIIIVSLFYCDIVNDNARRRCLKSLRLKRKNDISFCRVIVIIILLWSLSLSLSLRTKVLEIFAVEKKG